MNLHNVNPGALGAGIQNNGNMTFQNTGPGAVGGAGQVPVPGGA